jgi:hypothetical protein
MVKQVEEEMGYRYACTRAATVSLDNMCGHSLEPPLPILLWGVGLCKHIY